MFGVAAEAALGVAGEGRRRKAKVLEAGWDAPIDRDGEVCDGSPPLATRNRLLRDPEGGMEGAAGALHARASGAIGLLDMAMGVGEQDNAVINPELESKSASAS